MIVSPYAEGVLAFESGLSRTACPYLTPLVTDSDEPGSDAGFELQCVVDWQRGWDEAKDIPF